jgi:hypothetical protein
MYAQQINKSGRGNRLGRLCRSRLGGLGPATLTAALKRKLDAVGVQTSSQLSLRVLAEVVVLLGHTSARAAEHTAPHGEVDEHVERGHNDDSNAHPEEALRRAQRQVGEEHRLQHCSTGVASGADQAVHQAGRALRDEGHHTAGQTARLLAPDGEDDEDAHRDGQAAVHGGDAQQHAEHTAQRLDGPQHPKAAAHAVVAGSQVADHAARRAGEDVHHAKDTAHGASNDGVEAELVVQVVHNDVVDHELNTKAVAIVEHHDPGAVVEEGGAQCVGAAVLDLHVGGKQLAVVAIGRVLARQQDEDTQDDVAGGGYKERPAPGGECRHTAVDDALPDQGHEEVCHTTTHVTPASGNGVGGADNLGVEHGRRPELAAHECSQGEADEQAQHDEAGSRLRHAHAEDWRRGQQQQEGVAKAGAVHVDHVAHHDTGGCAHTRTQTHDGE